MKVFLIKYEQNMNNLVKNVTKTNNRFRAKIQ